METATEDSPLGYGNVSIAGIDQTSPFNVSFLISTPHVFPFYACCTFLSSPYNSLGSAATFAISGTLHEIVTLVFISIVVSTNPR